MKVVQSASLCDTKKVSQQVAKLEARVYKLNDEAKQKTMAETAKLTV